jgi:hypothetical protein
MVTVDDICWFVGKTGDFEEFEDVTGVDARLGVGKTMLLDSYWDLAASL